MIVSLINSHFRRDGRAKRRYNTLSQAEKAILTVKRRWGHDMRQYRCDLCQGFHLSRINKTDPYDKKPEKTDE